MLRQIVFMAVILAAAACGTDSSKIQGNQTGGIVPDTIKSEQEQLAAASAFCAQFNKTARVTASQAEASGRLIFVCDSAVPAAAPSVIYSTPQTKK